MTPDPFVGGAVVERTYVATLAEVWALWTTADGFASWWGPDGFRVEVHELDARVGGRLAYDMIAARPDTIAAMKAMGEATRHGTHGTFTVVEPHRLLRITHVIDFLAGVAPYDNHMQVELVAQGPNVRMTVRISPHLDPKFTEMSVQGFESQLGKLEPRFTRVA